MAAVNAEALPVPVKKENKQSTGTLKAPGPASYAVSFSSDPYSLLGVLTFSDGIVSDCEAGGPNCYSPSWAPGIYQHAHGYARGIHA